MRYLLLSALAALSLSPLPSQAIASRSTEPCNASTEVAQRGSCYQVARNFPPSMMKCQQVGQTSLGVPIWLCCD